MPSEVIIKLKNADKSTTYKYLEYDIVTTAEFDEVIERLHKQSVINFGTDEIDKESITIKLIRD